jgi:aminotransferase
MKPLASAVLNAKKSSIRKLFELVLTAKNAVSFGIGQPNFAPPDFVIEEIIKAVKEKKMMYAPTLGIPQLRQAIADKCKAENNMKWVEPKNIIVTNGGSQALELAYACLCNPGDEIIVNSPSFLSYFYIPAFYGLKTVEVQRKPDFSIDIEGIKKAITPKTKFIMINTPNNPTGYAFKKNEMDEIVQIVLENDLYLVSDEVYEKFLYEGRTHTSPASYPEMADRTLTLNAMSKTFGAPGLRCGYVAASENIITLMEKFSQYTSAGVNHPTQLGAAVAYQRGNPEFANILKAYDKKRQYCMKRLDELGFETPKPYGSFYIMPKVTKFAKNSDEFSERLMREVEVAVVPGSGFGSYSDDYVRISYATEDRLLEEGFNRIEKFLKNLSNQ